MKRVCLYCFLLFTLPAKAFDAHYIEQELQSALFENVSVGIHIAHVTGEPVYRRNAEKLYIPASALKLASSAFALKTLGVAHRISTPVFLHNGNLIIEGRGDPTLTGDDLDLLAQTLHSKGLREVNDIIYDNSQFILEPNIYAPNARHLYAPPSALTVNYGWIILKLRHKKPRFSMTPATSYARLSYKIKVTDSAAPGMPAMTYKTHAWGDHFMIEGTVTEWDLKYNYLRLGVSRPALYTVTLLKEALQNAGITVNGSILSGHAPANIAPTYEIHGKTVGEAVKESNQESNNLVAEQLNMYVSLFLNGSPSSRETARKALETFLSTEAGIAGAFKIADASGLSAESRLSPAQFSQLLSYIYQDEMLRPAMIENMAHQGFHPHAAAKTPEGISVYVKSGTLPATGVNSSVGYLIIDSTGEAYTFALFASRTAGGEQAYSGTYTNTLLQAMIAGFNI